MEKELEMSDLTRRRALTLAAITGGAATGIIAAGGTEAAAAGAAMAPAVPGSWTLFYDWNCTGNYSQTSMTVNSNGTWTNGQGYSGSWVQEAGMFLFDFNNSKTTYGGNLASKSITGIQTTFGGLSGCFYMLEAGAPAAHGEKRVAGHADSEGKT
jgi:hypothetical protein